MHNENIEQLKLNVRLVRRSFVEKLIGQFILVNTIKFLQTNTGMNLKPVLSTTTNCIYKRMKAF